MISITMSLLLILLATLSSSCLAQWGHIGHTDSSFIHNNDTITLVLSSRINDMLRGPAGSLVTLEFILTNQGKPGHFQIEGWSEEGFSGQLTTPNSYLASWQQQTIAVVNMRVPDRPEGDKVSYTLSVRRVNSKRSADPEEAPTMWRPPIDGAGGAVGGAGGAVGGAGGAVGGAGGNFGGSGGSARPNAGSDQWQNWQGDQIGSSGSSVGGPRPGSDYMVQKNDPSYRDEASITVLFTITGMEMEDVEGKSPVITKSYAATDSGETCETGPSDSGCESELWYVKFTASDKESGLMLVNLDTVDSSRPDYGQKLKQTVYYRYKQFPIGSQDEVEIVASSTCCNDHIQLKIMDVAGNEAVEDAYRWETGSGGLSPAALWGIIGGAIALVVIVAVIVTALCCTKYKRVPTNVS